MPTNTATARSEFLPTRRSLLSRLRNWEDADSWRVFHDLYGKLLHNMARQRGLSETEAQEAVQETVVTVARTMPQFQYQPARCSFKSWLRHLLEKKVADQYRKRARADRTVALAPAEDGDPNPLDLFPDPATEQPDAAWDAEWHQHVFATALEAVKKKVTAKQFQIFQRLVVFERPAAEVARTLDVNIAQVYLTKHRVAKVLKRELADVEKELE